MKNFEERLERLEKITESLKTPQLTLSDAMAQFEEGIKLAKGLEKDLEKMEKKVEILLNGPAEQTPESEPTFDLFSDV